MSQTVVLKVGMSCQGCVGAVNRVLGKMEGVESYDINFDEQKVTVRGNVKPDAVFQTVAKTGKKTAFWEPETPAETEKKPAEAPAETETKATETPAEPKAKPEETPAQPDAKPIETPAPTTDAKPIETTASTTDAKPIETPAPTTDAVPVA